MAEQRLNDKVAIVSGAGTRGPMPGTGQATAILYARHGAKVLLTDLDLGRAEETQATIEAEGGTASVFQADATSEVDCRDMVDACVERSAACMFCSTTFAGIGSGNGHRNRGRISGPLNCGQSQKRHPDFQTRHSSDDRLRRWLHHQCFVHRRPTSRLDSQRAICCRQGRTGAINTRYRCASWPRQYPRELYRARPSYMPRSWPISATKSASCGARRVRWARKAMPGMSLGQACSWRVMNRVGYLALFCQSTPACWQPLH